MCLNVQGLQRCQFMVITGRLDYWKAIHAIKLSTSTVQNVAKIVELFEGGERFSALLQSGREVFLMYDAF